jgi:hypothetical protein
LTEQQSWQCIAQSKGMTYLQRLPEAIPEGQFLVHNSVGGGWVARPAADPSQATGRVKRGATTSFTAPAYWKFESTPLQERVRLSPDSPQSPGFPPVS